MDGGRRLRRLAAPGQDAFPGVLAEQAFRVGCQAAVAFSFAAFEGLGQALAEEAAGALARPGTEPSWVCG